MFQWHKTYRFWAIFCKFSIVCFPHPNLLFGKSLVLSVLYAVNWTAFAFKIIRHYLHESLSVYMTTVLLFGVRSSKGYEAEIPWTFSNVVQHTPFQPRVVHKNFPVGFPTSPSMTPTEVSPIFDSPKSHGLLWTVWRTEFGLPYLEGAWPGWEVSLGSNR